jgi:polyisoprenoid-binding protein YceI
MKIILTCLLILTPFLLQAKEVQTNYTVDKSHTQLTFEVDHLVISTVLGRFDDFEGEIHLDPKSKLLISIKGITKAASINTNDEKRDKHLRSADFFEVEKYPELTFEATNLKVKAGKKAKIKGQL